MTLDQNSACRNLEVEAGAMVNVDSYTLTVSGNLILDGTIDGTSKVIMSGSALKTVGGTGVANAGLRVFPYDKTILPGANLALNNLHVGGSAVTVVNNGILAITGTGNGLYGPGTLTQGSASARLFLTGTVTISHLNAGVSGNKVYYSGTGSQNVIAATYYDVAFAGAGTKTLKGNITVNDSLTIDNAAVLDVGSDRAISVAGQWNVASNGRFVPRAGTVTFVGSSVVQSILGAAVDTFATLSVNQSGVPGGVVLSTDVYVTDGIALSSGNLVLNDDTLTTVNNLSGYSASGYVQTDGSGFLRILYNDAIPAYVFPLGDSAHYSPLTWVASSMSCTAPPGSYSQARVVASREPNAGSVVDYIERYWVLEESGIVLDPCQTFDVICDYADTDVVGSEASLVSAAWDSSLAWIYGVAADTSLNRITLTGLTEMGKNVTAIGLEGFAGVYTIGGVAPDFPDIASALAAINGRTVVDSVTFLFRDGVYNEVLDLGGTTYGKLSPSIPVTWRAETMDTINVVISAPGPALVVEGKDNLILAGLTFETTSLAANGGTIDNSDSVYVIAVQFRNTSAGDVALAVTATDNLDANGVVVRNFASGIQIDGGSLVAVRSCDVQAQDRAVAVSGLGTVMVAGNRLTTTALSPAGNVLELLDVSARGDIRYNMITGNRDLIRVAGTQAPMRVEGNSMNADQGYALFVHVFADSVLVAGNTIVGGDVRVKDGSAAADSLDSVPGKFLMITGNRMNGCDKAVDITDTKNASLVITNNRVDSVRVGIELTGIAAGSPDTVFVVGNVVAASDTALTLADNRLEAQIRSNTLVGGVFGDTNTVVVGVSNTDNVLFQANNVVNLVGNAVVAFDAYVPSNLSTQFNNWFSYRVSDSTEVSNQAGWLYSAYDFFQDPKFTGAADFELSPLSGLLDVVYTYHDAYVRTDLLGTPRNAVYDVGAVESQPSAFAGLDVRFVLQDGFSFSPDGDGLCDSLIVIVRDGNGAPVDASLDIRDIAGTLVASESGPAVGWDGRYAASAAIVPAGAYEYSLTVGVAVASGYVYVRRK